MKPRFAAPLLAAAVLLSGLPVFAQSQARIVRLSYIAGDVEINRNGQGFERALMNMPIVESTRLWTRDDSEAEVEFEDGSTVRLAPNSSMGFSRLGLQTDGIRATTIDVDEGTVYFDLVRPEHDPYLLRLGRQELNVARAVRFRAQVQHDQAILAVLKGDLDIGGQLRAVTVHKNESITLDFTDFGHYVLANVIQPDPYDQWNDERVKAREAYSIATANYSGYPQYGWSDLSYYGASTYVPGYGYVWRPYGVANSWDPFSYGAWSYYPSFGYTWVSSYPWGWLPYRYGQWSYIPSLGWGWIPGGSFGSVWWQGPTVVGGPPGYLPPVVPRHGGPNPPSVVVVGTPAPTNPGWHFKLPPGDGPTRPAVRGGLIAGSGGGVSNGAITGGAAAANLHDGPNGASTIVEGHRDDDFGRGRPAEHRGGGPVVSSGIVEQPSVSQRGPMVNVQPGQRMGPEVGYRPTYRPDSHAGPSPAASYHGYSGGGASASAPSVRMGGGGGGSAAPSASMGGGGGGARSAPASVSSGTSSRGGESNSGGGRVKQ